MQIRTLEVAFIKFKKTDSLYENIFSFFSFFCMFVVTMSSQGRNKERVFDMVIAEIIRYARRYTSSIIKGLISSAFLGVVAALPSYYIKHVVDDLLVARNSLMLAYVALFFLILFLAKAFFMYLAQWYMQKVGVAITCDIREELFCSMTKVSYDRLQMLSKESIKTHFLHDLNQLYNGITAFMRMGMRSICEFLLLMMIAFYQNYLLTLVAFAMLPALAWFMQKNTRWLRSCAKNAQAAIEALSVRFQETLQGLFEIKLYGAAARERDWFIKHNAIAQAEALNIAHYEALIPAIIEFFIFFALIISLYVGIHQVYAKTLTAGELTSFFAAIIFAYQPLRRSTMIIAEVQSALACAERIFSTLRQLNHMKEEFMGYVPPINFKKNIQFQNVSFEYKKGPTILHNINLTINKGDRIAIVGTSGSGKSTLCNLLLGLLRPIEGEICIDNMPLSWEKAGRWREQIAYVSQHPFLFNATIKENVAYSVAPSESNTLAIETALKNAGLWNFIRGSYHGLDFVVGEGGCYLSGGQRQRLVIARALYTRRPIIIFDEATSSLDAEAEEIIAETIAHLTPETTIILIAHKPLLINQMARIFTMYNGRIIEKKKKSIIITPLSLQN